MPQRNIATLTGDDQFMNIITIRGNYDISVSGFGAGGIAEIELQRRRPQSFPSFQESDKVFKTDTLIKEDIEATGFVLGPWEYRLGIPAGKFTSGTFVVEIGIA